MYAGPIYRTIPVWSQRWVDGPFRGGRMESYKSGTQQQRLERYICDKCGTVHDVIGMASEPFFCRENHLIAIEPKGV